MKNKVIILVAMLFVFALIAGTLHAVTLGDEKAKSSTTVQKDDCCKKGSAEGKDKAECKDAKECQKKSGDCPAHKKSAPAPKTGSCPDTCPAKSACEKK